jgi:hypothetical protein
VTSGFVAPGVQIRSGRPFALTQELGGGIEMVGDGRIAAAIVGVGAPCDGAMDAVAPAPPQLMANEATKIKRAARDVRLEAITTPPFPRSRLQESLRGS